MEYKTNAELRCKVQQTLKGAASDEAAAHSWAWPQMQSGVLPKKQKGPRSGVGAWWSICIQAENRFF